MFCLRVELYSYSINMCLKCDFIVLNFSKAPVSELLFIFVVFPEIVLTSILCFPNMFLYMCSDSTLYNITAFKVYNTLLIDSLSSLYVLLSNYILAFQFFFRRIHSNVLEEDLLFQLPT